MPKATMKMRPRHNYGCFNNLLAFDINIYAMYQRSRPVLLQSTGSQDCGENDEVGMNSVSSAEMSEGARKRYAAEVQRSEA